MAGIGDRVCYGLYAYCFHWAGQQPRCGEEIAVGDFEGTRVRR